MVPETGLGAAGYGKCDGNQRGPCTSLKMENVGSRFLSGQALIKWHLKVMSANDTNFAAMIAATILEETLARQASYVGAVAPVT